MKKNSHLLLLTLILILAFVLRFYALGDVPDGLQQDETSIGYNAYSILQTGKDEHGVRFPQNFQAFGEYKLPGYIYASVLPIQIFGFTPFAIRFVSALSGFLSVILVYLLTKILLEWKQEGKRNSFILSAVPLFVTFLLAINPWHLHFSRAAFEVSFANFFILLGTLTFLIGIKRTNIYLFCSSIVFFCLSIYTYNIARLFTPVFVVALFVLFARSIRQQQRTFMFSALGIVSICMIPFLLGVISNGGINSTSGTIIFTSAKVQAQLIELRSYFIYLPQPLSKLLFNYWTLTLWQYGNNVVSHLSANFYFLTGGEHGNNTIGTHGQWYLFELPLIIYGLVLLWKERARSFSKTLFIWIMGVVAISSLTREPPQATRTFFLTFPITFCSAFGLAHILERISRIPLKTVRFALVMGMVIVASGYIVFYVLSYYIRFPVYYAKPWRIGDREASLYIRDHEKEYEKIIIDEKAGFMYTSLLTYIPFSPKEFQETAIWTPVDSEGFTHPTSFGKFQIRNIAGEENIANMNSLILTTPDNIPTGYQTIKTFYYPNRPVVFNVGQEIIQYPVTDTAYVLVTAKESL